MKEVYYFFSLDVFMLIDVREDSPHSALMVTQR
jgi:hypothetical protein